MRRKAASNIWRRDNFMKPSALTASLKTQHPMNLGFRFSKEGVHTLFLIRYCQKA